MTDTEVPLSGSTLLVGPSNVGKTRTTARALRAWIESEGTDGVVVFEFAPEIERDGRLLGGRLDRFVEVPGGVWRGVLSAHAPRAEGDTPEEALELAADNAARAERLLDAAPEPRAVFVNDATIPFQSGDLDASRLTDYCDRAAVAVLNAFESDELGTDDAVSRYEREALDAFRGWADRTRRLDRD